MSSCTIFNGSFVEDIIDILNSQINKQILSFSDKSDNNWKPFYTTNQVSNSHKEILIKSNFDDQSPPYECIPYTAKYNDPEINLNIINWGYSGWVGEEKNTWDLIDNEGETVKTYSANSGDVYGGKEVFANSVDLLAKIPILNNRYLNKDTVIDGYPDNYEFPARKQNQGIGIKHFFKHNQPTKNLASYGEIIIDWLINEKMGEIPFDGVETHHVDVDTHQKSYNRFLKTGKTCGNFIYLPPDINEKNFISIVDEMLPDVDSFVVPYGFKEPTINNIFIGKNKKASCWNWNYKEAVLCWYRYDATSYQIMPPNNRLPDSNYTIYVSEGDVFLAENINPIKILKKNLIEEIIPPESSFLYISQNIYHKFIKILRRLSTKNNQFDLLNNREKILTAAAYATGPSYDEITLDAIASTPNSIVLENIYEINDKNEKLIPTKAIQNLIDKSKPSTSFVPVYKNQASTFMNSINNQLMEKILKIPFKRDHDYGNMNYAHDIKSLIKILDHKYGSYIYVRGAPIVFKNNRGKFSEQDIACDIDFELLSVGVQNTNAATVVNCGTPSKIGYDQIINIGGRSIKTDIDTPFYNLDCDDNGRKKIINSSNSLKLMLNNEPIDLHVLSTGIRQTIFKDRYYRGSYELALIIDGEEICSRNLICDKKLKEKYFPDVRLPEVKVFQNNDIIKNRAYNYLLVNPNIDVIGVQNETTYIESNIFEHKAHAMTKPSQTNASSINIKFILHNTEIKVHNLNVEHLRSSNNRECRTLPIKQKCQCSSIIKPVGFSYACDGKLEYTGGKTHTPNISTDNIPIWGGRNSIYDDQNKLSYYDYSRVNAPVFGMDGKIYLQGLDRYYDPLNPYECARTTSVTLPVHTMTKWSFSFNDFPINRTRGNLWVTLIDKNHKFREDRNQIQAEFSDGNVVYPERWKPVGDASSVKLFNPFNLAVVDNDESPLYKTLPCSYENLNGELIHSVNLVFKYLPHASRLSFAHHKVQTLGALTNCAYSIASGLTQGAGQQNSPFLYDDHMFTMFLDSGNVADDSDSVRLAAKITPNLIKQVSLLSTLDNPQIKLHFKSGDSWITCQSKNYGYYIDKKPYLGFPMFFEHVKLKNHQQIPTFLPSYALSDPKFRYSRTKFDSTFFMKDYYNYLFSSNLATYFLIPNIIDIYQQIFKPVLDPVPKKGYYEYHKHLLNNNLNLLPYKNITGSHYSNQILIAKEYTFAPVVFQDIDPITQEILYHSSIVINKYIYINAINQQTYCLLRLIPLLGEEVLDYPKNIRNPTLYLSDTNLHINVYRNAQKNTGDNSWGDIYGYDEFKSFDITNRLNREYIPSNLAYDNILYQLGLFNQNHLLYHKKIPECFLNNIKIDPKKISNFSFSLNSNSNLKYDKSIVDYVQPFISINYFGSLNSEPFLDKTISSTGNFNLSRFMTINDDIEGLNGYFWIDIPQSDIVKTTLSNELNHTIRSQFFKLHEPHYLLNLTDTELVRNNTNYACSQTIQPTIQRYQNTAKLINGTLIPVNAESRLAGIQTDIYCDIDYVDCKSRGCDIQSVAFFKHKSKYLVTPETNFRYQPNPGPFYVTIGQGSYYNYPYITRTTIDNINRQFFSPNLMPDNTLINDGSMLLPSEEKDKRYPYGNVEHFDNDNILVDAIANEMLFRLYYGAERDHINLETIGSQSLSEYKDKQRFMNFKNLIESNVAISPEDIYSLIPYEYNAFKNSQYLTYNGNIGIFGLPKVGDQIEIQIGSANLSVSIDEEEDGIYITVNDQKVLFRQTKLTTSTIVAVQAGVQAFFANNTKLVGQCRIYSPGGWGAVHYYTAAILKGAGKDGADLDLASIYKRIKGRSFFPFTPADLANIDGLSYMLSPAGVVSCNTVISDYPSPASRGLIDGNPPNMIFSQSYGNLGLGGRGTAGDAVCLGTSEIVCGVNENNEPIIIRISNKAANAGLSPVMNKGSIESIAGQPIPRDPAIYGPNCSYKGCGPLPCLPLESTDKYGKNIFTYQKLPLGNVTARLVSACECIPYTISTCDVRDAQCDSCTSRDKTNFSYNYGYGPYSFGLRGVKYLEKSSETPVAADSPRNNFGNGACLDNSNIQNTSKLVGDETCGLTKSRAINTIYNIYEQTTTTEGQPIFKCPITILNITYDNNKILINIEDQTLCFNHEQPLGICPELKIKLPNTTYSFDNSISSDCASCTPKQNKITLSDKNPDWETVVEDRIAVLGHILYQGDKNNIIVGGSVAWIPQEQCASSPDPNACYDQDQIQVGDHLQCGKGFPDSYPWRYCINCRIPGSADATLIQQGAIVSSHGGAAVNCVPVGFEVQFSPQFGGASTIAIQEWKTWMQNWYLDVAPCHNNQNIGEEYIIEGVIPGSCGPVQFETVSYPGLAYRRTPSGSESSGFTLGVLVAYFNYKYKRPMTIQDKLGKPECVGYNMGDNPAPPIDNVNIKEFYVNKGPCNKDITCVDTRIEKCDSDNYCCITGKVR